MVSLKRGSLVIRRYRLNRCIGEGGMGVVWEASDLVTDRRVALKFLKLEEATARRRFVREMRITTALRHPNIIAVHEVLEGGGDTPSAIVMELLEGESLAGRLRREQKLPVAAACAIGVQIVRALEAAHAQGVVHRDLKPENVFLTEEPGGVVRVKVLDFGIAKVAPEGASGRGATLQTTTGTVLGTPQYMAPEQLFAERDIDFRADIWSLGVVLFESLAGERPVDGENVGQVIKAVAMGLLPSLAERAPDLPSPLVDLVTRMLSHDRDARVGSLREVMTTLGAYATGTETPSIDLGFASPPRPGRSWRIGGAASIALALAASIFVLRGGPPHVPATDAAIAPLPSPTAIALHAAPTPLLDIDAAALLPAPSSTSVAVPSTRAAAVHPTRPTSVATSRVPVAVAPSTAPRPAATASRGVTAPSKRGEVPMLPGDIVSATPF